MKRHFLSALALTVAFSTAAPAVQAFEIKPTSRPHSAGTLTTQTPPRKQQLETTRIKPAAGSEKIGFSGEISEDDLQTKGFRRRSFRRRGFQRRFRRGFRRGGFRHFH